MERKVAEKESKRLFQIRLGNLMENVTQSKVMQKTGISRQNLAKYLTGKALPNSYTLSILAAYFNVSCDYLLGIEDGKNHDTAYIVRETGLSEQSVQLLHQYVSGDNKNKENLLFAINQLLGNKNSADFLLSFTRYIATPSIDREMFSDDHIYELYAKYDTIIADTSTFDLSANSFDEIKKDDIIYYQLMRCFDKLLDSIKNNEKTKEEYKRSFEEKARTEHELETQEKIEDITTKMSKN